MPTFRVVPVFDELQNRMVCFVMRMEIRIAEQFMFQRGKKTLGDGVIVTIAFPAHALNSLLRGQGGAVVVTRILTAAVRVLNQTGRWAAPLNRVMPCR